MQEATQRAIVELIKAVEKHYGPIEYVTMCQPFEESAYFKRIVAGTPAPRKRSSRRQLVQAKRARLGLPVDGKVKPFMWSGELCKPTRKQCYTAALQADRMIKTYAHMGDAEAYRLPIVKHWIQWL
jgi:hypothetical protein